MLLWLLLRSTTFPPTLLQCFWFASDGTVAVVVRIAVADGWLLLLVSLLLRSFVDTLFAIVSLCLPLFPFVCCFCCHLPLFVVVCRHLPLFAVVCHPHCWLRRLLLQTQLALLRIQTCRLCTLHFHRLIVTCVYNIMMYVLSSSFASGPKICCSFAVSCMR